MALLRADMVKKEYLVYKDVNEVSKLDGIAYSTLRKKIGLEKVFIINGILYARVDIVPSKRGGFRKNSKSDIR